MLRRRIITLDITSDEGDPTFWDWPNLVDAGPNTEILVVNVVEEKVT